MKQLCLCLALLVALPALSVAQGGGGGGRGTGGGGGQDEPRFDTKTVGTYTGVVTALSSKIGKRGTPRSRLTLRSTAGDILVHVGPTAFLDAKSFHPAVGDRLIVIGSKVKEDDGSEVVIVRQITRGQTMLMMRSEDGRPLWDEKYKGR